MAQLEQTATRVKPPAQTGKVEDLQAYIKYLADIVAILGKNLDFIINGNLDAHNIRAESVETRNLKAGAVTAEKISVEQLSAISADLGHITAGLIEAVTIVGSLIQTSLPGIYPRIEFSSTDKLLRAEKDANTFVELDADLSGDPGYRFISPLINFIFSMFLDTVFLQTFGNSSIRLSPGADLFLQAGNYVQLESWNKLRNETTGRTLQQDLNSKANVFTGRTGSVLVSAAGGGVIELVFNNGICVTTNFFPPAP